MKQLLLITLLPFIGFGQMNSRELRKLNEIKFIDDWEMNGIQAIHFNQKSNHVKTAKVQSVTYLHHTKKKKTPKVSYKKWYNEDGKVIRTEYKSDTVTYAYKDTLLVSIHRHFKKDEYFTAIQYDDQNRIISKTVEKNHKPLVATYYAYYKNLKRTKIERKTFGRKPHTYVLVHEYEPILDRLSKSVYTIDGEIKQTWNYECNEKGKIVDTKIEAMNSQCHFEQNNLDGSYSVFTRSIVNGKVQLTESLYTADSVFIGYNSFYNDSLLKSSYRKNDAIEVSKSFSKRGKLIYHYEKEMDEFGNQLSYKRFNKAGKITSQDVSQYNEFHLLTSIAYKEKYFSLMEYTYY